MQCHSITITPVYKAYCHRGSKQKVYWLVGTNLRVYKPVTIPVISLCSIM